MGTTGKSSKSISSGGSTRTNLEPASGSILCRRVVAQAIKDVIRGSEKERAEVVRWLVSDDFGEICRIAGLDQGEWKLRIADLFRASPGMRMYYAKKMLEELAD